MESPESVDPSGGLIAAGIAAVVGAAFALRKLATTWKAEAVTQAQFSAQESVVTQLHGELQRLHAHNTELIDELHKLQMKLVELTGQLAVLTAENAELRGSIAGLRAEVDRLRSATPDCANCTYRKDRQV